MIPLRIAQVIGSLKVSAASSAAINISRWLSNAEHHSLIITSSGDRVAECEATGQSLLSYKPAGPSWLFGGRKQLLESLRAWSPDVLHVQRPEAIPLALRAAKDGVPVVYSVHGLPDERTAEAILQPSIAAVTVPNEYMRSRMAAEFGCSADRISVFAVWASARSFRYEAQAVPQTVGCFADEDVSYSISMIRAAIELEPILSQANIHMVVSAANQAEALAIIDSETDRDRWRVSVGGGADGRFAERYGCSCLCGATRQPSADHHQGSTITATGYRVRRGIGDRVN